VVQAQRWPGPVPRREGREVGAALPGPQQPPEELAREAPVLERRQRVLTRVLDGNVEEHAVDLALRRADVPGPRTTHNAQGVASNAFVQTRVLGVAPGGANCLLMLC